MAQPDHKKLARVVFECDPRLKAWLDSRAFHGKTTVRKILTDLLIEFRQACGRTKPEATR
jgi:hypothetical protein